MEVVVGLVLFCLVMAGISAAYEYEQREARKAEAKKQRTKRDMAVKDARLEWLRERDFDRLRDAEAGRLREEVARMHGRRRQ